MSDYSIIVSVNNLNTNPFPLYYHYINISFFLSVVLFVFCIYKTSDKKYR